FTRSAARPRTPTIRPPATAMSIASPLECSTEAEGTQRATSASVTPGARKVSTRAGHTTSCGPYGVRLPQGSAIRSVMRRPSPGGRALNRAAISIVTVARGPTRRSGNTRVRACAWPCSVDAAGEVVAVATTRRGTLAAVGAGPRGDEFADAGAHHARRRDLPVYTSTSPPATSPTRSGRRGGGGRRGAAGGGGGWRRVAAVPPGPGSPAAPARRRMG